MRASQASTTNADLVGTMREGVLAQKHLLIGKDGSPINFDLNVGRTGNGGWQAPRHRHNFDQIRYVIKGTYPYGKDKILREGCVGYFPESVYYGPQDRPEGLETMVLQFGGASGNGYLSVAQREAANEALKQKGEFKNGVFTYYDEKGQRHNQDGSEACFEHATGRKLEFAPPRYEDVIVMDPSAYAWIPQGAEGMYVKWLGSFGERSAGIGFIRLDRNAIYGGGERPSVEILFQTKGRVAVSGQEYGPESAFEFLPNEGPIPVRAIEPSEFLCMVLHRF
jgi:hypothetical protein